MSHQVSQWNAFEHALLDSKTLQRFPAIIFWSVRYKMTTTILNMGLLKEGLQVTILGCYVWLVLSQLDIRNLLDGIVNGKKSFDKGWVVFGTDIWHRIKMLWSPCGKKFAPQKLCADFSLWGYATKVAVVTLVMVYVDKSTCGNKGTCSYFRADPQCLNQWVKIRVDQKGINISD